MLVLGQREKQKKQLSLPLHCRAQLLLDMTYPQESAAVFEVINFPWCLRGQYANVYGLWLVWKSFHFIDSELTLT